MAEAVVDLNVFISHFSGINRLRKAFCYLAKFVKYIKGQPFEPSVSLADVKEANQNLIKWVQKSAFSAELKAATQNKPLAKSSSLRSLCPLLCDGVLCVGGRLDNTSGYATKHPVILPHHHFTSLLVREV